MEVEDSQDISSDNGIILQSDIIKYDEAYKLNHFQPCDAFSLVDIMSMIFDAILKQTDPIPDQILTIFHGKCVPNVKINDYILRILKYGRCSSESVVISMIYIDRLIQLNREFLLNSLNIHR